MWCILSIYMCIDAHCQCKCTFSIQVLYMYSPVLIPDSVCDYSITAIDSNFYSTVFLLCSEEQCLNSIHLNKCWINVFFNETFHTLPLGLYKIR